MPPSRHGLPPKYTHDHDCPFGWSECLRQAGVGGRAGEVEEGREGGIWEAARVSAWMCSAEVLLMISWPSTYL